MNLNQLENTLNYLVKNTRYRIQGNKIKTISFIQKYSIHFIGNRNYLQEFDDDQITLYGILVNLKNDILQTLRTVPLGAPPVPAMPVGPVPMNVEQIQDLIQDLSEL